MPERVDPLIDRLHGALSYVAGPGGLPLALLLVAMLIEAAVRGRRSYDLADTLSNLGLFAGNFIVVALWAPWMWIVYDAVHARAPFDLGPDGAFAARVGGWRLILLFLVEDLCFYAFHRSSHRVRLLWASHENHHSSERFNFSVALRQTWTPFSAIVFWLPLPLLGFAPTEILAAQAVSLAYQSFTHSEAVPALGPLEWVFNTPAHHRVHHGADEPYIDKNFGGVLIVWDRLFGTLEHERPGIRYGLGEARGHGLLTIAFTEWRRLLGDLVSSRSVSEAVGHLFRAPGWKPARLRKDPAHAP